MQSRVHSNQRGLSAYRAHTARRRWGVETETHVQGHAQPSLKSTISTSESAGQMPHLGGCRTWECHHVPAPAAVDDAIIALEQPGMRCRFHAAQVPQPQQRPRLCRRWNKVGTGVHGTGSGRLATACTPLQPWEQALSRTCTAWQNLAWRGSCRCAFAFDTTTALQCEPGRYLTLQECFLGDDAAVHGAQLVEIVQRFDCVERVCCRAPSGSIIRGMGSWLPPVVIHSSSKLEGDLSGRRMPYHCTILLSRALRRATTFDRLVVQRLVSACVSIFSRS